MVIDKKIDERSEASIEILRTPMYSHQSVGYVGRRTDGQSET